MTERATRTQGSPANISTAVGWTAISTLGAGLLNYAYTLTLAFVLVPRQFTVFAAGAAVLLVMGTMASAAAPWMLARELAQHPTDRDARRTATMFAMELNLLLGVISAIIVGLACRSFAGVGESVLLAISTVVIFVSSATAGYLQGDGRYSAMAGYRFAEVVIKLIAGALLVRAGAGAAGGIGGFLVSDALMLLIGFWIMRGDLGLPRTMGYPMALWRNTVGLAATQGLIALILNLDTILVATLSGIPAEAAAYQLSSTVSRAPVFYSTAVSTVAYREIIAQPLRAAIAERRAIRMFAYPAIAGGLVVATVPAGVFAIVAPHGYGFVLTVIPFTAITGVCYGVANLYSTFFQARLQFAFAMRLLGAGAGAMAAVVVAGHYADGVVGLAISTAIGAVGLAAVMVLAEHRSFSALTIARGAAACGAAALLYALLRVASVNEPAWIALSIVLVIASLALGRGATIASVTGGVSTLERRLGVRRS